MKEREHLENQGADWRITFKWILKEQDGRVWTGLIWPRIETSVAGPYERLKVTSGCIKRGGFFLT